MNAVVQKLNGYKTYAGILLYVVGGLAFGWSDQFGPEAAQALANLGGSLQELAKLLIGTGIIHKFTKAFPQAK